MFSSTPPDADPCCRYGLCEAILKLWCYYAMHIITMAFLFPNKITPISLYLLSEHASFFLISKVLIVSFAEISKQMRDLRCLWSLGFEETERDPVCLCDSAAKIIPLWNARVGKSWKVVYSPFKKRNQIFNQKGVQVILQSHAVQIRDLGNKTGNKVHTQILKTMP